MKEKEPEAEEFINQQVSGFQKIISSTEIYTGNLSDKPTFLNWNWPKFHFIFWRYGILDLIYIFLYSNEFLFLKLLYHS